MSSSRYLLKENGTVTGLGKYFTHLKNNVALTARNATNTADVDLIKLNASNAIEVGASLSLTGTLTTSGTITSSAGNVNALAGAVQTITGTFTNGTVTGTAQASALPGFIVGTTSNHVMYFYTNNTAQLNLDTSGILDFTATMANSALDPTTDAPIDWVQIKIDGTAGYIPVYAAS